MKTLITILFLSLISFSISAQTNLDSGLVAYFPFNGNANDESGNGHDGTINGNALLIADRFNSPERAYTFPDQSSSISLANSVNMNLEAGFTINAWIKYKSGGTKVIVCKHACGFVNGFIFWIDTDGQIKLLLGQNGWSAVGTNQSFVEDEWYMVTATYDAGTSTAKVYVDGEAGGSGSVAYNNFSSNPISIGESYQNNCVAGNMNGAVDEVKIYNRPLSAAEILDEYNNTKSELVLFLPFNGNANDESGNNNNGTVNGATLTQDRFGVPGKAYYFNGTNARIEIPHNNSLNINNDISISVWIKPEEIQTSGNRMVIGKSNYSNATNYIFRIRPNAVLQWEYFTSLYTNSNSLTADNWYHLVFTADSTTGNKQIYINGDLILEEVVSGSGPFGLVTNPLTIGAAFHFGSYWAEFFKGSIDDIRIYKSVLNYDEVQALYNDSTTYFPDSLIAYFPFNGNANDESVFHNNGSALNALLTTDRYANQDAAYYFNGSDSRIQVPQNSLYDFGFGDFTMSAWVNVSVVGTSRIVSAGYDENDNIWGLGFGSHPVWGNGIRINYFLYSDNAFRDFSSEEIINYSPGEWIFVTISKSADQIKFYQNGMQAGAQTINYPSNSNSLMSIGCRQYSSGNFEEFFNGKIDEVKIFNKSFSDQEILQMYKSTTSAPNLQSPANNSIVNTLTPLLVWDSLVTATNYSVQIATDSLFNTIVLSQFSNAASYLVESGALNPNVDYYWRVRTNNDGGVSPWSDVYHFTVNLTGVEDETQLPKEFALNQNYPNPFNPSTVITYHLPKASNVKLIIYDVLGNEIATLVDEYKPAGSYEVEFNPVSSIKHPASGIYLYQLKAGDFIQTKKMLYLK